MATDPGEVTATIWAPQYDILKSVFKEAHEVINEYRPHQARETLIQMMEEQVRRGREEIKICEEAKERVRDVLMGLGTVVEEANREEKDAGQRKSTTGKRKRDIGREAQNRRLWSYLNGENGRS